MGPGAACANDGSTRASLAQHAPPARFSTAEAQHEPRPAQFAPSGSSCATIARGPYVVG